VFQSGQLFVYLFHYCSRLQLTLPLWFAVHFLLFLFLCVFAAILFFLRASRDSVGPLFLDVAPRRFPGPCHWFVPPSHFPVYEAGPQRSS
jgi:hypothetical protein